MKNKEEKKKRWTDFWKSFLFFNFGIKMISVICAVLFWLLITNIADPYKTKNFLVSVQTIHEEAISSVNQVYEVIEGKTASVSIRGRRSVVDKLSESDIVATADLSHLSAVNAVPVKAEVKHVRASDITVDCDGVLKIALEEMEKKQIKVIVNREGTPADGYAVGECIAKPNVIEVIGAETVIDRIATVEVSVNVNGASESFRKTLEPYAYDSKHHKITSATLSFNVESVKTTVRMYQKKEIPVKIEITGTPAEGYEFVEVNSSPETIEVAGNQKALSELSEITVPVDITGLQADSGKLEQNIDISKYISENLSVPNEEDKNVSVKVLLQKMQTKTVDLSRSQISLVNVRDGYRATLDTQVEKVSIEVMGTKKVLAGVASGYFRGQVNCADYGEGIYYLPVELEELGEGLSQANVIKVRVNIKKK